MTAIIDELCPSYVGEQRITLALGAETPSPSAFDAVDIDVNYDATEPDGVIFPLELTILAPSPSNFVRKIYARTAPTTVTFQPKEGGRHIVRLAEIGHNRWFGFLRIDVIGESTTSDTVT